MKKIFVILASFALFAVPSVSQERSSGKLSPVIEFGAGYSIEQKNTTGGLASELSFGIDWQLNEKLSVMPSIGGNIILGHFLSPRDGEAFDYTHAFANAAVLFLYHTGKGISICLGPAIYCDLKKDVYFSDLEIGGKQTLNPFDYGLKAKISKDLGKHWLLGVQADLGLRNMLVQYPEYCITGTDHLYSFYVITGFRF